MARLHTYEDPTSPEEADEQPYRQFTLKEAATILRRQRYQLQRYAQAGVIHVSRDENGWRTQRISGAQLADLWRHPRHPNYVVTGVELGQARLRAAERVT